MKGKCASRNKRGRCTFGDRIPQQHTSCHHLYCGVQTASLPSPIHCTTTQVRTSKPPSCAKRARAGQACEFVVRPTLCTKGQHAQGLHAVRHAVASKRNSRVCVRTRTEHTQDTHVFVCGLGHKLYAQKASMRSACRASSFELLASMRSLGGYVRTTRTGHCFTYYVPCTS